MTLITLDRIERRFGDVEVLTRASMRVDEGDRIGVVGGNGTGKTTLIRILAGVDDADRGTRTARRHLRIAYAKQIPELGSGTTVLSFVERGDGEFQELENRVRALEHGLAKTPGDERLLAEYGELQGAFEAGGGYSREHLCRKVLGGVGFAEEDWQKDVSVLSGGERSRLVLASMMTAPAELLILDEPTNHLDIQGIDFVENHIARYVGAVVVISHDRHFLDAVARRIVEVEGGTTAAYKGNYSAYREQRDQQIIAEARVYKNQQEFIDKEMEYIRRNMAGRMSTQAKGRLKKLQRLQFLAAPRRDTRHMKLEFVGGRGLAGQTMLEAEDVTLTVPGGRELVRGASFRLLHGETVGMIGRNGTGKSTMMMTLAGLREPQGGKIVRAYGVKVGYFSQQVSDLPQAVTALEAMRELEPQATEKELRDHLALFLITGDQAEEMVANLSGGQKQRLSLARLVRSDYDLLCLDEPTNHLDIQGREALQEALSGYPGAILMITHDRHLLERATDRVLLIEDGRVRSFDGGLSQCLEALAAERSQRRSAEGRTKRPSRESAGRKNQAAAGKIRNPMMFQRLEEEIFSLEEELEVLREEMTKEENYRDAERMRGLQERESELQKQLADGYARWENWS